MDTWFDVVNVVDTKKVDYRRRRLDISLSHLRKAQAKFKRDDLPNFFASTDQTSRSDILQSTDSQVSSVERNKESVPAIYPLSNNVLKYPRILRGAALPVALMDDIDLLATELISLLSFLSDIEEKQPKPKPRLPWLFKSLPHGLMRTKESQSTAPSPLPHEEKGISSPTSTNGECLEAVAARSNPTSVSSKDSRLLQWILAPEIIFAVRIAVLGVAIFAVNVSKTTVKTYMENAGVVALLLGQVGWCLLFFWSRLT